MMKYFNTLLLIMLSYIGYAQNAEMADVMRENGKIYVVVGVLVIIFIGIVVYLISLDKKISSIEKSLEK